MLERQKPEEANVDYVGMGKLYEKHLKHIEQWLEQQENMDVIYINYNDLIINPLEHLDSINRFLGNFLNIDAMMQVIDVSLYRNRSNAYKQQ